MYELLIIDDNKLITESLEKSINWNTLDCAVIASANNGADGRTLIELHQPDILITDIMMPGENGLEMISKIRDLSLSTKIIILTGYGNFSFAQNAIKLGVFDYLLKPASNDEIIATVQRAIESIEMAHPKQSAVYEEGSIEAILDQTRKSKNFSKLIKEVIQYIDRNINQGLSLGSVANEFLVTSSYLSNTFKKETGRSFIDYVNMCKMCKAKQLLKNPKVKVYEVGNILGYKNYVYFYQVFKKYCGFPPSTEK